MVILATLPNVLHIDIIRPLSFKIYASASAASQRRPVMSTLVLPMASPKSLKRTYEEAELETQSPGQHHSQERSMAPPTIQAIPDSMNERSLSGAFTQPNVPVPNLNNAHSSPSKAFDMPLPPGNRLSDTTQKSKLTFAEKEVRRIEKEYKDQQRAEEKVKREEERLRRERDKNEKEQEKAKKIEERRLKDEDRRKAKEERERVKAEEKAKKEEEKQKREEEKNKKARVCLCPHVQLFQCSKFSVTITSKRLLQSAAYKHQELDSVTTA